MTRYFVTAWCDRPFYAQCEVHSATPQEALAKARELIHDAPAEECDQGYFWDEWRVDTDDADGVLLHLDEPARNRNAATQMHETLEYVALMLADFKPDFLRQIGLNIALEKVEAILLGVSGNREDQP
jgi:hypothetical protein